MNISEIREWILTFVLILTIIAVFVLFAYILASYDYYGSFFNYMAGIRKDSLSSPVKNVNKVDKKGHANTAKPTVKSNSSSPPNNTKNKKT